MEAPGASMEKILLFLLLQKGGPSPAECWCPESNTKNFLLTCCFLSVTLRKPLLRAMELLPHSTTQAVEKGNLSLLLARGQPTERQDFRATETCLQPSSLSAFSS